MENKEEKNELKPIDITKISFKDIKNPSPLLMLIKAHCSDLQNEEDKKKKNYLWSNMYTKFL